MAVTLSTRDPDFEVAFQGLLSQSGECGECSMRQLQQSSRNVARRGDAAVIDYTQRFDGVDLTPGNLRLTRAEIATEQPQLQPRW